MNRQQRRSKQSFSLAEVRAEARREAAEESNILLYENNLRLIDAFLLAMHDELKVGSIRGNKVLSRATELATKYNNAELAAMVVEQIK